MGTFKGELNSHCCLAHLLTLSLNWLHKHLTQGLKDLVELTLMKKKLAFVLKYSYLIAEILGRRKIITSITDHILTPLLSLNIFQKSMYNISHLCVPIATIIKKWKSREVTLVPLILCPQQRERYQGTLQFHTSELEHNLQFTHAHCRNHRSGVNRQNPYLTTVCPPQKLPAF